MKITNSKIEKLREQLRLEEKKEKLRIKKEQENKIKYDKDKAYKAYLMINEKCESNPVFKADFREVLIKNFKAYDFRVVHFLCTNNEGKKNDNATN
ncbi:hypothetical protein [Aggregatibacter actinomycetemcomitans]|uniref:hypothetical protein n=1 Tax=Aggregatibacter actinomycetemcomitans TaxID=714 RepID=UPI0011D903DE|nr:hypothetical protein [Aggregatibacter actinomycetemcomitans]TYB07624.1 hypothetical protein FXB90_03175 [Aggregatibacter actinomycetemcomitans]